MIIAREHMAPNDLSTSQIRSIPPLIFVVSYLQMTFPHERG